MSERRSPIRRTIEVAVLVDRVPTRSGLRGEERRTRELVRGLAALVPEATVVVVSADWRDHTTLPGLASNVEVVACIDDWHGWAATRGPVFACVTGPIAAHRFAPLLVAEWAAVPLLVDRGALTSPERSALPSGYGPDGAAVVSQAYRDADRMLLDRAAVVLCASVSDEQLVADLDPTVPRVLVPGLVARGAERPFLGTRRVGFVASFLEGLNAPAEDAALFLARDVLPELDRAVPGATLRVVGEDIPPVVRGLARGPGVDVRWLHGPARAALASCEVVVAVQRFGRCSMTAGVAGLEADVPVLGAGPSAPAELVVDPSADPATLAAAAAPLLTDPGAWTAARDATRAHLADWLDAAQHRSALTAALRAADVPETLLDDRAPDPPAEPLLGRRTGRWIAITDQRGLDLPLPDVLQAPGVGPRPVAASEVDTRSYDAWYLRRTGQAARRSQAEAAVARFASRPRFSVVVPVHDTDPDALRHVVESVRAQWYERWELWLADHDTTRADTLHVLQAFSRADPRITVKRPVDADDVETAVSAVANRCRGDFIVLLDDHQLEPAALFEIAALLDEYPDLDLVYPDAHDRDDRGVYSHPVLRPGFSPELLLATNYVGGTIVLRRALFARLGGLRSGFDGAAGYDLLLRAVEHTSRVGHLAQPVARRSRGGDANGDGTEARHAAERRAVRDALTRRGRDAHVEDATRPGHYRVRYDLARRPEVAIVVPTRDRVDLLRACIDSIRERSTYDRYEVIVVDNGSVEPETLDYLESFGGWVLRYPFAFHYARMMNFAAATVGTDQLLFLNNDIEVLTPDWLEILLEHGQHAEVGAVGAHLAFPDGVPQHEGVLVGWGARTPAANLALEKFATPASEPHLVQELGDTVRNFSAVTGACLLIRPSVYWEVGGLDERLHIAFNDVDLGLKLRHRGYEVVYTPDAQLVHNESATRGSLHPLDNDSLFRGRWAITAEYTDPYGNPNYDPARKFYLRP